MMYALCSFVAGYYWNIIWLDALALLPLMLAGMVSLLREGRFRLYTLALALSLLCNYYLSFFCCIFVGLSFFVWCICRWDGWKRFFRRFCRIALCTLLGVGMAAVLLLPTLYGLQNTHSAGNEAPELLALNIAEDASGKAAEGQSTLDLLKEQTLPGLAYGARRVLANLLTSTEPTKMEGLPNVYCGFAAVALAVFFLCCKKVRLREKLLSVGLLAFFLLSFLFRTLDYYWARRAFPQYAPLSLQLPVQLCAHRHGLPCVDAAGPLPQAISVRHPSRMSRHYPVRAGAGGQHAPDAPERAGAGHCMPCARAVSPGAQAAAPQHGAAVCRHRGGNGLQHRHGRGKGSRSRRAHPIRASLRMCRPFCRPVPEGSGRVEVTSYQTLNDAALNGYRGISIFTSSANVRFNRFSRSLGLASWPQATATSIMRAARSRI